MHRVRPARLSDDEVQQALVNCPGWSLVDGKLQREFQFADFQEAFAFMTRCAEMAESLDHHPEWWNVYNRVRVDLTTHDVGGVTSLDFDLARAMNGFAA